MPNPAKSPRTRRAWRAPSPVVDIRRFLRTEASGGAVLLGAALIALVLANSPWRGTYEALWHRRVVLALGGTRLDEDLRHLVNDGLMALFFFAVGLEIKREAVHGELANLRVAALPVAAAAGGMLVPALLFTVVNAGRPGSAGWGIPMATDIAFALAVLAVAGRHVPPPVRLLLLTLAIADDIGAILVIAVAYSRSINGTALAVGTAGVVATYALLRAGLERPLVYVVLGVVTWYATYRSGIHATIAGVALGVATPAQARAGTGTSPAVHLEERLRPWTRFVILPVFALANAGVAVHSGIFGAPGAAAVATGVAVGLVVGKFAGVLAGAWLAVRLRAAALPVGVRWTHVAGMAALAGIGFTVSLFVTELAFETPALVDAAKVAVLGASVVAAAIGAMALRCACRDQEPA